MSEQSFDLSKYVPQFDIIINAKSQKDIVDSTVSVQITEQVNSPTQFNIAISDKFDPRNQEFTWLGNPIFAIGNNIMIEIGYVISKKKPEGNKFDRKLVKVLDGSIKSLSTSGFSGDIPRLTVTGFDNTHSRLTEKSSAQKAIKPEARDTYGKIVGKIADAVGLKSEVDETKGYSKDIITKKPSTLLDFLKDAARRTGYEFFVSRGTLYFINPRSKRDPKIVFEWEKDVMQFNPSINASELYTAVEVRGHLPDSRTKVVGKASAGEETKINQDQRELTASQIALRLSKENLKTIENRTFSSQEEADDMARAELNRVNDNLVTGSASIVGNPDLAPGTIVDFKNFGTLFSGLYFVTSVTNTIDNNGYTTSFCVRKNSIRGV